MAVLMPLLLASSLVVGWHTAAIVAYVCGRLRIPQRVRLAAFVVGRVACLLHDGTLCIDQPFPERGSSKEGTGGAR